MRTINRVGVLSVAKVLGALYALLGFIFGAIFTCISLVGAVASQSGEGMFGALFGIAAIIIFPIMYGAMGFIAGLLVGFLYNLIAGQIGGIEIEAS